MRSSSSHFALLSRGKFSQVSVVVSFPVLARVESELSHFAKSSIPKPASNCDDYEHTFCDRRPWTRQTQPWESRRRPRRPKHLGRLSPIRSQSSGDSHGWCRRASQSLSTPPFAQSTKLYAKKHVLFQPHSCMRQTTNSAHQR